MAMFWSGALAQHAPWRVRHAVVFNGNLGARRCSGHGGHDTVIADEVPNDGVIRNSGFDLAHEFVGGIVEVVADQLHDARFRHLARVANAQPARSQVAGSRHRQYEPQRNRRQNLRPPQETKRAAHAASETGLASQHRTQ